MESMGKKKPRRPRRSFMPDFKAEIVGLCRRGDRSVGQVARDFELTETAVRDWVKQAEVDAGERSGLTSSEREELAALRRENRRLREDVDVLEELLRGVHYGRCQRGAEVVLGFRIPCPAWLPSGSARARLPAVRRPAADFVRPAPPLPARPQSVSAAP